MKALKSKTLVVLGLVTVLLACGPVALADSADNIPLPEYEIVFLPLDLNAPPGLSDLLGEWRGCWKVSNLNVILVIEEIIFDQKRVRYLYAWEAYRPSGIKPGFRRDEAELILDEKNLGIKFKTKANFWFFLKKGKLKGKRTNQGFVSRITMKKMKGYIQAKAAAEKAE